MDDRQDLERMRADWNERAGEDAYYYVAFGRREQDDDEFFATGKEIVNAMEMELQRLRAREAALEIGCGPGRLMRPLSRHFAEIHGVDVSDKMIRLAGERLRDTPNAHAHHGSGSDLKLFPDEKFDFVYSYAVFQHIPSRDVVLEYLREARRVLKTEGILRCQINGLPQQALQSNTAFDQTSAYNTWSGVRFSPDEIARFAAENDFQLLAVEQVWTQYMWVTCRKRPRGWSEQLHDRRVDTRGTRIRNLGNVSTGEAVAPSSGLFANLAVFVYSLPADCDLNYLTITADGKPCRATFIGQPERDGATQVNATLPAGLRTGLVPIELAWMGRRLCEPEWIRIVPANPPVPRIMAYSDAVNLLSGTRIVSRLVKITMREVERPETFRAFVDERESAPPEFFCVDPMLQKFEFNFRVPDGIGAGGHHVRARLGRREFAPLPIEVA